MQTLFTSNSADQTFWERERERELLNTTYQYKNGVVTEGIRSGAQELVEGGFAKMEIRRLRRHKSRPPFPLCRRSRQTLWGWEKKSQSPGSHFALFFLCLYFSSVLCLLFIKNTTQKEEEESIVKLLFCKIWWTVLVLLRVSFFTHKRRAHLKVLEINLQTNVWKFMIALDVWGRCVFIWNSYEFRPLHFKPEFSIQIS